ncbi:tyrosine-protein phosphatase non-receptor type 20 isoform X4 [Castor canadensis]|uniref:Tyrosine-protein phosphatase non-receptor type 20 n=2 Tax=Castor canadensis TaxID=51338 RepID=A0A8B7WI73_CASCN|nr:tyrosine-protein phosphatase non-receptor type 20 [Castor canadensis]
MIMGIFLKNLQKVKVMKPCGMTISSSKETGGTVRIQRLQGHQVLSPLCSLFNIMNIVTQMRKQRYGMIQTKEQYHFCYEIVLQVLQKLLTLE